MTSQRGARCQYVDDEYKPEIVKIGHLEMGRRDLKMDR